MSDNVSIQFQTGNPGRPGSQTRSGSAVPTTQGIDGDWYFRTNGDCYLKVGGSYVLQFSIIGPQGIPGVHGIQRYGSGVPSNGTGIDGDTYADTDAGDIYERVTGAYIFRASYSNMIDAWNFGARPTATATANLAALQAALNTGRKVWLRKGTYALLSGLTIPAGGGLYGEGPENTIIDTQWASSDNTPGITANSGAHVVGLKLTSTVWTTVTNVLAWDFAARGIQLAAAATFVTVENCEVNLAGCGVDANSATSSTVRHFKATNIRCKEGFGPALHATGANGLVYFDITAIGCDRGCEVENASKNVHLTKGYFESIYPVDYVGSPGNIILTYTFVLDAHTHGGQGHTQNISYTNCYLKNCGQGMISANANTDWNDIVSEVLYTNIIIDGVVDLTSGSLDQNGVFAFNIAENITCKNVTVLDGFFKASYLGNLLQTKRVKFIDCKFYGSAGSALGMATNAIGTEILNCNFSSHTVKVTNRARASNVATLTLSTASHGLVVGDTIGIAHVAGLGSGYSTSTATAITAVSGANVSYANTGSDEATTAELRGFVYFNQQTPMISDTGDGTKIIGCTFRRIFNGGATCVTQEPTGINSVYIGNQWFQNQVSIATFRARTSNVATITFARRHNMKTGDVIIVENIGGTGYDVNGVAIASTPSDTTITFASSGSNESSTASTGDVYLQGAFASTGSALYLHRLRGQQSQVSGGLAHSGHTSTNVTCVYVDSTVTGGSQATVTNCSAFSLKTTNTAFLTNASSTNYSFTGCSSNNTTDTWTILWGRPMNCKRGGDPVGDGAINAQTADYTALLTDDLITVDATATGKTVTLPAAANCKGVTLNISKIDVTANTVTIDANGSELIDGSLTHVLSGQWDNAQIRSTGAAWKVL